MATSSSRLPAPSAPERGPGGDEDVLSSDPVPQRRLGLLLVVGGVIGFLAAFTLTVERIRLAGDPSAALSCDINPFISCGSVMTTWQARLFGFPNPLIGIAAFSVATTLGVLLLSGTALPRWVRRGWLAGITLGFVFVCWLISQSLYVIGALCPYCMVAWAVVIPMFWTSAVDSLDRGVVPVPAGARRAVAALVEYRLLLTVVSYAVVVVLIGQAFWSQWVALL